MTETMCVYDLTGWARLNKDRERFPPNNILLMLAGAGLLWMGGQVQWRRSHWYKICILDRFWSTC